MKKNLFQMVLSAFVLIMVSCSTARVVRTKATDPMLRVAIDFSTVDEAQYVELRRALVETGKFQVIDRREGFAAALREQNLQYESSLQDRFDSKEKYIRLGKLLGVRAVIVPHAHCYQAKSWLGEFKRYCKQDLAFLDAATGEIQFEVGDEASVVWTAEFVAPEWTSIARKVVETYPEYFNPPETSPMLESYKEQSAEHARRQEIKKMQNQRAPASSDGLQRDLQLMRDGARQMKQEEESAP